MSTSSAAAVTLLLPALEAGGSTTCGIGDDGSGYCWGRNVEGQIGDGTNTDRTAPTAISGGHRWASLSNGWGQTCGVTLTGQGYCWGNNSGGQLGDGTTTSKDTPTLVAGGHVWRSIDTSFSYHTCGVTVSGQGYCWGWNSSGELGDGTNTNQDSPTLVTGGHTWRTITTGWGSVNEYTCGVTTTGDGYCWGDNGSGPLGDGTNTSRNSPTAVSGGHTWATIVAGNDVTCGVTDDSLGYCWGDNPAGQIGDGTNADKNVPTAISGGHRWDSVWAGGWGQSCGVTLGQVGYCWGNNVDGQLGDGTNAAKNVPTPIAGEHLWLTITTNYAHSCGVTVEKIGYCWGWNDDGQLGDTTTTSRNQPVSVSGGLEWGFIDSEQTVIGVTVDPAFTLAITAHAGSCNGVAQSPGVAVGATAVALGRLTAGTQATAAQTLTVDSNAFGYNIYLRSDSGLASTNGHTFDTVPGPNSAPSAFPSAGTEAFGYTTDDATLGTGTVDRFTNPSAQWAALSGTNSEVAHGSSGPGAETTCVALRAGTASTTPAGLYTTTLIYTGVPIY